MNNTVFDHLHSEGLLSDESFKKIKQRQSSPLFSVHWELKTALYTGVLLLSTGLGILVYKNIDSIGHQVVLAFIAVLCAGCLGWCNKNKKPFSFAKVESPNSLFDYVLLLGVLSFLSLIGYLQVQYGVFGDKYGLATFLPMVVLFFFAYYFDHIGVLTLAITNLAIWMGVTVTPKDLLEHANFNNEKFIYTYLLLGCLLLVAGWATNYYGIKKHFAFSYHHYGVHVTFIALLSGYFFYDYGLSFIWLSCLAVLTWFIFKDAYRKRSFYFLLLCVLYNYIAFSGLIIRSVIKVAESEGFYLISLYFVSSGFGLIIFLTNLNRKLKSNDHLQ
ncbi:DUF2157 domain-containing protein [Flavihumibacter sp. R14]|nr:DUF2157 domain-containing protein [Flavihumibacter soli]